MTRRIAFRMWRQYPDFAPMPLPHARYPLRSQNQDAGKPRNPTLEGREIVRQVEAVG